MKKEFNTFIRQAERLNSETARNGGCDSLVCMEEKNMQRLAEMTSPAHKSWVSNKA